MRLGVNAFRLTGQRLGVGRYIEYLLKYWDQMLMPGDRVTVYVKEPVEPDSLRLSDTFRFQSLGTSLPGVLWEQMILASRAGGIDVLFCPSYTMPLTYRGRCVLANHSVNEVQAGAHPWWYHLTYRQRYRLSALKADVVIVPSETVKDDIQEQYGVPSGKIEVIPQGVDDSFCPGGDAEALRATRRRYLGSDRPYILFVGKLSQRRNIPTLMAAFSDLKKRAKIPHSLLLVGPNHQNLPLQSLAQELGIQDSLVQTDGRFADHRELVAVYNAADLFVHPSLHEGFSLTLVEAMACGVPVVTVNRGAAREIAGGCAFMVDEPTTEALSEAMHQALTDPTLARTLRARALERARCFRYEETARRTMDVLRRVAAS